MSLSRPHRLRTAFAGLVSTLCAAALAAPAGAADPGPDNLVLAGSGAFAKDSEVKRLAAVFGKANVRDEMVDGAEGESVKATVLYPKDPARRAVVCWLDDANRARPAGVLVTGGRSLWTLLGVHVGDGGEAVAKANGKPFKLSGFGWDYEGDGVVIKSGDKAPTAAKAAVSTIGIGFSSDE